MSAEEIFADIFDKLIIDEAPDADDEAPDADDEAPDADIEQAIFSVSRSLSTDDSEISEEICHA